MEAILRFIFVVIIIYYGFRLVFKYVVPWLLGRFMKKQQDKFNQMSGFGNSDYDQSKEGEVRVKKNKSQKTNNTDDEFGEYVDFEDVDDQ